jgi:hypothetical protein
VLSAILAYFNVSTVRIPPAPLPIYAMCAIAGSWSLVIEFITISLAYCTKLLLSFNLRLGDTHSDHPTDLLAFSFIVRLVVRHIVRGVLSPRPFKTIAQDATYCFLFIFTSHLVVVLFLLFGSVRISSSSSIHRIVHRQTAEIWCTSDISSLHKPAWTDSRS